ncbi:MAG: thermonuclease family protein [Notoacmeibacter sp.]|uniref:thermonuclease family protein n=1 Tax=Albidovulum sp. TaxID=1872424 RepID=UPI001D9DB026|nr:thermonuclease family protein [Notoacmeibacter sp.]MCB2110268.1 thermonuclease family protein [Paracoccaceae bacterium]MCC0064838.1 thermonuclease family protein [Defluviimonas sp.]
MARRSSPPERLLRLALWLCIGLAMVMPAATAANGLLKPHLGCAVLLVVDGDTVKLLCPGEGIRRARLLGFDTPEIFSPACLAEFARGIAAMAWLEGRLLAARHYAVAAPETGPASDRYGRRLVSLRIDGLDVAGDLTARGLARPYAGGRREGWCA